MEKNVETAHKREIYLIIYVYDKPNKIAYNSNKLHFSRT